MRKMQLSCVYRAAGAGGNRASGLRHVYVNSLSPTPPHPSPLASLPSPTSDWVAGEREGMMQMQGTHELWLWMHVIDSNGMIHR